MTKRIASAIAVAGASVALLLGMIATPAQAETIHGCPSGYVCLYKQNAGWNNDKPSHKWYRYGTYKIYNQYGNHYIFNNQTGGAVAWVCRGSNGTDCPHYISVGQVVNYNFTPINSVKLVASL